MPSLSERLKSLGVKVGAQNLPTPASLAKCDQPYSIEKVVTGREIETPAGKTFVIETSYPNKNLSNQTLNSVQPRALRRIARWAGDDRLHEISTDQIAFLDTETSGLSGGTGTLAFLVGVGRIIDNEFRLAQYFLRDPAEEAAMLLALEAFLAPCTTLATFNGKAFDAPLLNTRYTLQGWRSPLFEMAHIDLLPLARRLWRETLPSRTLGNLEVHILGYGRSEEEVPGWMIPQLYFEYLQSGDARQMKNVLYHNAVDVVSMTSLLDHMACLVENPLEATQAPILKATTAFFSQESATPAVRSVTPLEIVALARLCEDLGEDELAVKLYQHSLSASIDLNTGSTPTLNRNRIPIDSQQDRLPEDTFWDSLLHLALLYKRRGDYDRAIPLWEIAAQKEIIHAHIELAKTYEHVLREPQIAIQWTTKAVEIVQAPAFPNYERKGLLPELEHRLQRLQHKLRNQADHNLLSPENQ